MNELVDLNTIVNSVFSRPGKISRKEFVLVKDKSFTNNDKNNFIDLEQKINPYEYPNGLNDLQIKDERIR